MNGGGEVEAARMAEGYRLRFRTNDFPSTPTLRLLAWRGQCTQNRPAAGSNSAVQVPPGYGDVRADVRPLHWGRTGLNPVVNHTVTFPAARRPCPLTHHRSFI
ncbi:hypothetical protein Bbelb_249630 [Branchiostoma belcheri]|nr:hypothetical protein Bbelb_249630 [Branchiostoma belcheri]